MKKEEICCNCVHFDGDNLGWCDHNEFWGFYAPDETPCNGGGFLEEYPEVEE